MDDKERAEMDEDERGFILEMRQKVYAARQDYSPGFKFKMLGVDMVLEEIFWGPLDSCVMVYCVHINKTSGKFISRKMSYELFYNLTKGQENN